MEYEPVGLQKPLVLLTFSLNPPRRRVGGFLFHPRQCRGFHHPVVVKTIDIALFFKKFYITNRTKASKTFVFEAYLCFCLLLIKACQSFHLSISVRI